MEKWEKHISRKVNAEVPSEVDQRIELTLTSLPHQKKYKKKWWLSGVVALVVLSFLFSTLGLSKTIAERMSTIPVLGSVMEMVGGIEEREGQQQGLTTPIGEQVQIGDGNLTFTETMYDGQNVYVSFVLTEADENAHLIDKLRDDLLILIDGKPYPHTHLNWRGEYIEENVYAGTLSFSSISLPDSFLFTIRSIGVDEWQVDLPVERKGEKEEVELAQTFSLQNSSWTYQSITFSPTTTKVHIKTVVEEDSLFLEDYSMRLDIQDGNGRNLRSTRSNGGLKRQSDGSYAGSYTYYFEPYKGELPQEITIKPYLVNYNTENNKGPAWDQETWQGKSFTLGQGEMGELTVLDVQRNQGDLVITYQVDGNDESQQAASIWIEDQSGNRYKDDGAETRLDNHTFQQTFYDFPKDEKVTIFTEQMENHDYMKELEFTFPVQ